MLMISEMRMPSRRTNARRAMTLIELLITIVILLALTLTIAPALGHMRGESNNDLSKANLMQLGQSRDQYALDNADRIFAYSWRAGESYKLPTGQVRNPNSDQEAAAFQNQEILMRRTGRINGATKIQSSTTRLPHRRFSHLVLLDYLAADDNIFNTTTLGIDPADQNVLTWHERPLSYGQGSGVPYAETDLNGYDEDFNWSLTAVRQRWAFASSYEIVPFAWQGDGPNDVYVPVSSTPHLYSGTGSIVLGQRLMSDVAFASQKVHMHEDHDREQKRFPWFAYDHAAVEKLMFDGSINSQISGEANDSYSPADPNNVWRQRYVPIQHYPIPLGGFNDSTELNMRFRWTKNGLQGIDYPTP
ncbi:MAG: hypothetical protein CMJ25_07995 [Phycisphaerae bacterium]|nr:hypothetical protein [Phycisphaerae bacterium]